MSNTRLQKADFSAQYQPSSIGRIEKRSHTFGDLTVTKVRFPVGVSVTEEGRSSGVLNGSSCPLPHTAYVLTGTLGVQQDDGSEEHFTAGDVMLLPPGHEAWTIGDEDCTFVEFSKGHDDFYA